MNTFFKWFSLITCVVSVPFIILLAYAGHWLDVVTWTFLGIAGFFNYQSAVMMMESEDDSRS